MTLTSSYSPSGEVPSWTVPAWSLWPIEYSGINSVWFTRPDHKRLLTLGEAGGGGLVTKPCLTLATPWTVARQTPLSVGFSRQEYWSGLPCPSPGDLPNPGIEPRSPACRHNSLPTEPPGKPWAWGKLVTLLEKAVAPHSSTLAWKIPWMEEPGGLQSVGSLRVGQDWAVSLSLFTFMHWRRKWQPTPVFLPGESQGW